MKLYFIKFNYQVLVKKFCLSLDVITTAVQQQLSQNNHAVNAIESSPLKTIFYFLSNIS